ncbi:MAG: hypothetical protein ACYCSN_17685 [Acidobacteriaceae bacterium]
MAFDEQAGIGDFLAQSPSMDELRASADQGNHEALYELTCYLLDDTRNEELTKEEREAARAEIMLRADGLLKQNDVLGHTLTYLASQVVESIPEQRGLEHLQIAADAGEPIALGLLSDMNLDTAIAKEFFSANSANDLWLGILRIRWLLFSNSSGSTISMALIWLNNITGFAPDRENLTGMIDGAPPESGIYLVESGTTADGCEPNVVFRLYDHHRQQWINAAKTPNVRWIGSRPAPSRAVQSIRKVASEFLDQVHHYNRS